MAGQRRPVASRPLRAGDQREPAAAALRVETMASLVVAVNELRVLTHRAEDSTRVDRAQSHGLLRKGVCMGLNVGHPGDQNIGRTSMACLEVR